MRGGSLVANGMVDVVYVVMHLPTPLRALRVGREICGLLRLFEMPRAVLPTHHYLMKEQPHSGNRYLKGPRNCPLPHP